MTIQRLTSFAFVSALLGCGLDVPDLNNPGLTEFENDPSAAQIEAAATGLLIGDRAGVAPANGYVAQLGILGREAYNFDGSDPRFVSELLAGELQGGSVFGGAFWGLPYANIRLANLILTALDKIPSGELSDDNKAAIRGFTNTIQALDLLIVINAHDTNGAVIDTDIPLVLPPAPQPLGAIVDKDAVFARIAELLDSAAADLGSLGPKSTFPFAMSRGYAGFDTPPTFLTFTQALRARIAVYRGSGATGSAKTQLYSTALEALAASFLDDDALATPEAPISFTNGVYHAYSTKTGDATNGLINPSIYVNPLVEANVQKDLNGANDARYTAKVRPIDASMDEEEGSVTDTPLKSSLKFKLYPAPDSSVTIIRNEELILLKAEALFYTGNVAGAIDELNVVRTGSGKLPALIGTPGEATFLDELLYERAYSLLFEAHRWIDLRRFGRTDDLVLEDPTYKRNIRYPFPIAECNARPGEARCELGSL